LCPRRTSLRYRSGARRDTWDVINNRLTLVVVGRRVAGHAESMATRLVCVVIRLYQVVLSPMLAPACRFYPSCSTYALQATTRYGVWKGLRLAGWRLLRCHPFHPGGWDPVR
jgi:hypothetical protein